MNLDKKFPSVADMEVAAKRRLPGFARDYLFGAIGNDLCLQRNRAALDAVMMMPRYLSAAPAPDIRCTLFGREYDAPFGVAPVGLSGLIWPHAEQKLAAAAKAHNIPYTLSTVATVSLERIFEIAAENSWFQYYPVNDPAVEKSIFQRCAETGYETLLVTVDVPFNTRRAHDIRNGLSVPPAFDLRTLGQMLTHPTWALKMLRAGVPQFENITQYYQGGKSIAASVKFLTEVMKDPITAGRFSQLRERWQGKLLVKGVLDPLEAKRYLELGADGIVVSNHGGRQADAAPASATMLPAIRAAVGPQAVLIADSGARSGLDVAKMLALGADFVLMGRAFLFAVSAADQPGAHQVMQLLKAELKGEMAQLGSASLDSLSQFLHPSEAA